MTAGEHAFDPPKPTPGAHHCGGRHYAKATRDPDGAISWRCTDCGMERVMADRKGWR